MKKNLVFASLILVAGVSQVNAQEKEGEIPEVTIAAKTTQQLYKTGKNVQLISSKDLEKYKGQNFELTLNLKRKREEYLVTHYNGTLILTYNNKSYFFQIIGQFAC